MTKFLTLKHWQLFLLLVGIPTIFEFVIVGVAISSRNPTGLFILFPILMILSMGLFFCWFYSLGTNLFNRLPVTAKMSLTTFKIFLFIPAVYFLSLLVFLIHVFFSRVAPGGQPDFGLFALILPLHLFSMFCMFYCLYFNAKALKMVELQKPVTFNDYAGEFFLLWFFPIGIWILQPKINKLFSVTSDGSTD